MNGVTSREPRVTEHDLLGLVNDLPINRENGIHTPGNASKAA